MKAGVFGGTFDPIHLGHLGAAEATRRVLGLDRVIFIPAGLPWLKTGVTVSAAHHRLEMVRLALAGCSHFELSRMEIDRPGPSYTVDTVRALRREMGQDTGLFLLLGSDALGDFPRWKEPERLMEICRLAAFSRPNIALPPLDRLERAVPGISGRIDFVEIPQVDVSATEIRRLITLGESIGHLVPRAVEGYIVEHDLYADDLRRPEQEAEVDRAGGDSL
ncbi:MAG: nicotinate-nucleotide adenylyltransferase [Chloroflexi bacterium]|nr:nicotinate-nucleotide adenylyltransferase [Chloroflexota bacterium]